MVPIFSISEFLSILETTMVDQFTFHLAKYNKILNSTTTFITILL
jgi:hypothetical protein